MTAMEWKDRTLVEKICIVFAGVLLAAAVVAIVVEAFMLHRLAITGWVCLSWGNFLQHIANRRAQPASVWNTVFLVLWGLLAVIYTVFIILQFL